MVCFIMIYLASIHNYLFSEMIINSRGGGGGLKHPLVPPTK